MALRRAFAQEDINSLATANVATTRNVDYKDIDLTFTAKTTSGEIFKKNNAAAVKQAVKTLIMTNLLEKPFKPEFGGDIQGMLFELADDRASVTIRRNIVSNLKRYEPRAKIISLDVEAKPDNNAIAVDLTFKIVNTEEVVNFSTTLSRLR
mgnify:FL=1